jgi:hypothetical protein
MSTWRSSAQWRPPTFGWFVPTEFPPFLAPCAIGALLLALEAVAGDAAPSWPQRLDELGLFGGHAYSATLLYSPLWGFPAVLAAVPLRGLLMSRGRFGWGSALVGGAVAGLAIPLMLGRTLWLDGPLYGAVYLSAQSLIYRMLYPDAFDV